MEKNRVLKMILSEDTRFHNDDGGCCILRPTFKLMDENDRQTGAQPAVFLQTKTQAGSRTTTTLGPPLLIGLSLLLCGESRVLPGTWQDITQSKILFNFKQVEPGATGGARYPAIRGAPAQSAIANMPTQKLRLEARSSLLRDRKNKSSWTS